MVYHSYWRLARHPLYVLTLLSIPVVVYEAARLTGGLGAGGDSRLLAPRLIELLFAPLGAAGAWLPPAALVATLLISALRQRPWRPIRPVVPLLMALESALCAVPLLVLGRLLLVGATPASNGLSAVAYALGAGVYEELLFRMYIVGGLCLALNAFVPKRARRLKRSQSASRGGRHAAVTGCGVRRGIQAAAILTAAIAFALCHVQPVGVEAFDWPAAIARTLAGCYLGLLYVTRGLGVAAGAHAVHNVVLVLAA